MERIRGIGEERLGAQVKVVCDKIGCQCFLDRRLFARRDFGLKLRDYPPGHLAFDYKYIRDIAIVPLRPKLAVRPCINQLSVDKHSTTGALHAAFQYMRYAQVGGDLAQVSDRKSVV